MAKSYQITNDDIISQTAKDLNEKEELVDKVVKGYEDSMISLTKEIIEKDKDFGEIQITPMGISGVTITRNSDGETLDFEPLISKDIYESIHKAYGTDLEEIYNNRKEELESKTNSKVKIA